MASAAAAPVQAVPTGAALPTTVEIEDDALLVTKARLDGTVHAVIVTPRVIRCVAFDRRQELVVHMPNVYGVEKRTRNGRHSVVVYTYVPHGRDPKLGDPRRGVDATCGFKSDFEFVVAGEDEQNEWLDAVRSAIVLSLGLPIEHHRRYLILINPFGGKRTAKKIYNTKIWPMLCVAGVEVETIFTTHASHAIEIGRALELGKYDVVATVSGDGLLFQLLNGLMDRPDWARAIQQSLGILPGGSSNAQTKNLDCETAEAATFNILRGVPRPIDIMAVHQGGKTHFAHLSLTHGLIADIDVGSDRFRFMGPARMTLAALAQLMALPRYPVKVAYKPAPTRFSTSNPERVADVDYASQPRPVFKHANVTFDALPPGWVKRETSVTKLTVSNSPYLDQEFLTCPMADMSDGYADLMLIEGTSTRHITPYFLEIEKGTLAFAPFVEYFQIEALHLEPTSGLIAVDGELIKTEPVTLEVLPRLARFVAPPDLAMPRWTAPPAGQPLTLQHQVG